jgi:hypothetical protein
MRRYAQTQNAMAGVIGLHSRALTYALRHQIESADTKGCGGCLWVYTANP